MHYSSKQRDHMTLLEVFLFSTSSSSQCLESPLSHSHFIQFDTLPVVLLCIFFSPCVTAFSIQWNMLEYAHALRHKLLPPSSSSVDNTNSMTGR